MSLMAVLFIFAAMAVFSGLLIVVATARSAQITRELEHFNSELQEIVDEPYVTAPRVTASASSNYPS